MEGGPDAEGAGLVDPEALGRQRPVGAAFAVQKLQVVEDAGEQAEDRQRRGLQLHQAAGQRRPEQHTPCAQRDGGENAALRQHLHPSRG
jgi:hypothetical protein